MNYFYYQSSLDGNLFYLITFLCIKVGQKELRVITGGSANCECSILGADLKCGCQSPNSHTGTTVHHVSIHSA